MTCRRSLCAIAAPSTRSIVKLRGSGTARGGSSVAVPPPTVRRCYRSQTECQRSKGRRRREARRPRRDRQRRPRARHAGARSRPRDHHARTPAKLGPRAAELVGTRAFSFQDGVNSQSRQPESFTESEAPPWWTSGAEPCRSLPQLAGRSRLVPPQSLSVLRPAAEPARSQRRRTGAGNTAPRRCGRDGRSLCVR